MFQAQTPIPKFVLSCHFLAFNLLIIKTVVYIYYNQSHTRLGHFAYLSDPLSPEFIDGLPTYSSQMQIYY